MHESHAGSTRRAFCGGKYTLHDPGADEDDDLLSGGFLHGTFERLDPPSLCPAPVSVSAEHCTVCEVSAPAPAGTTLDVVGVEGLRVRTRVQTPVQPIVGVGELGAGDPGVGQPGEPVAKQAKIVPDQPLDQSLVTYSEDGSVRQALLVSSKISCTMTGAQLEAMIHNAVGFRRLVGPVANGDVLPNADQSVAAVLSAAALGLPEVHQMSPAVRKDVKCCFFHAMPG